MPSASWRLKMVRREGSSRGVAMGSMLSALTCGSTPTLLVPSADPTSGLNSPSPPSEVRR